MANERELSALDGCEIGSPPVRPGVASLSPPYRPKTEPYAPKHPWCFLRGSQERSRRRDRVAMHHWCIGAYGSLNCRVSVAPLSHDCRAWRPAGIPFCSPRHIQEPGQLRIMHPEKLRDPVLVEPRAATGQHTAQIGHRHVGTMLGQ